MERGFGIYMPILSLSNKNGYGCISKEAYDFIDFLSEKNIKYWQIDPLFNTNDKYNNNSEISKYSGDPLYIDLEKVLVKEELDFFKLNKRLSFEEYKTKKKEVLSYVFDKLYYSTNVDKFIEQNENWVYDYAVFMALKEELNVSYKDFPVHYKNLDSKETIYFIQTHSEEIIYHIFLQQLFFSQWKDLKKYANSKGVKIITKTSLYSREDSSDVYSKPRYYQLLKKDIEISKQLDKLLKGEDRYKINLIKDTEESKNTKENETQETQEKKSKLNLYAEFDYENLKNEKFSYFVENLEYLSKIYDFVIIDDLIENKNSSEEEQENIKSVILSNDKKLEILSAIKNANLKHIILGNFGNNLDKTIITKNKINYPVTKIMTEEFENYLSNLKNENQNTESTDEKNALNEANVIEEFNDKILSENLNLPINYEKNTVVYLSSDLDKNFVDYISNDEVKKNICRYLQVPSLIKESIITKIAIEYLCATNANVCIVAIQDILCDNEECKVQTTDDKNYVYRLNSNYQSEKYFKFLKQVIANKNR